MSICSGLHGIQAKNGKKEKNCTEPVTPEPIPERLKRGTGRGQNLPKHLIR